MTNYITMTRDGVHGNSYRAHTDDDATAQAEAAGYEVLDVMDDPNDLNTTILVVA